MVDQYQKYRHEPRKSQLIQSLHGRPGRKTAPILTDNFQPSIDPIVNSKMCEK